MIISSLEELLSELEKQNKDIFQSGKKMLETYAMYPFDLFCTSILNRSVNIIRGYIKLVRDENFIAAAPLVRLHLDSLLRLFAPSMTEMNLDDFALEVIGGKSIRDMKNSNNKKLTDRLLVDEISKLPEFTWVQKLYEAGNYYVHFSIKHVFSATKLGAESRTIQGGIRLNDELVKYEEKLGGTQWMFKINNGILQLIDEWTSIKNSYYKPIGIKK